ncbi:hypothetical protein SUGI_0068860 [Cryptomeria japonica]|nr:hypothetical protein SUGI_0068860 [Cryptomeria japonica]
MAAIPGHSNWGFHGQDQNRPGRHWQAHVCPILGAGGFLSYPSVDDKGFCSNVCVSPSGDVDPGGGDSYCAPDVFVFREEGKCIVADGTKQCGKIFILGFFLMVTWI